MGHERNHRFSPVQQQARALADPTRYRIFRHVSESSEPPRVASISRQFGLSESAVRQHLTKLCEAGLVFEEQAVRKGPGRPPLQYRVARAVGGDWRTPSPYQELTLLVLELVRTGESSRQVGVAAGLLVAPEPEGTTTDTLDHLEAEMARRGFEPQRVEDGPSVDLVLRRCAYEAAALADPDVICDLHRGLAEGITAASGSDAQTLLDPRDPRQAGCRLRVRVASGEVPVVPGA